MKVFVTGAAGFIGLAVVDELTKHGHEAIGLARSDSSADKITKAGGKVHRGDLTDLESLKSGAQAADGVIHLAFIHDFSEEGFAKALAADQAAIEAMGEAIAGTGKPLVIAGGLLLVAGGSERATEETPAPPPTTVWAKRGEAEVLVQKLSREKNIRGAVVRLAPTVHGKGEQGFVPILAGMAAKNGYVTVVGDGATRWPSVHRFDAAALFRLVAEKGRAGAIYHAAAEEVTTKDLFEKIGQKMNLPVESKSVEEAMQSIGFFAFPASSDNPVSSESTQKELGWKPTQPGLLDDIEANYDLSKVNTAH